MRPEAEQLLFLTAEDTYKGRVATQDDIIFMGFGDDDTTDISVPIKGIVKFSTLDRFWDGVNIIDVESLRECMGYITGKQTSVKVSEEVLAELERTENEEEMMFSEEENILEYEGGFSDASSDNDIAEELEEAREEVLESAATNTYDVDKGVYTLALLKLKKGVRLQDGLKKVNAALQEAGVDGRAIPWRDAVGQIGDFAFIIKAALNGFVVFIFFVAIIVIMNTLSMTALERINEIGMMRAVGSQKRFISGMFLAETGILSLGFGGLGIVVGVLVVNIVAGFNIGAGDNDILQLFFGGDTFNPLLLPGDVVLCIVLLAIVTFIAVVYPVYVARRITPLEAIARD